jgi:hypothetical protein
MAMAIRMANDLDSSSIIIQQKNYEKGKHRHGKKIESSYRG